MPLLVGADFSPGFLTSGGSSAATALAALFWKIDLVVFRHVSGEDIVLSQVNIFRTGKV